MERTMDTIAKLFVALLVVFSSSTRSVDCAKILLTMSSLVNTPSQHIVISAITEPLVARGHDVILLAPQNKFLKGLSAEAITGKRFFANPDRSADDMEEIINSISSIQHKVSGGSVSVIMEIFKKMLHLMTDGCRLLFEDTAALESLKKEQYDLIITLPLVGCDPLLAEYLGVPFVVISPVRRSIVVTEDHFGIPIPASYVPFSAFTTFSDEMSFKERLLNNVLRFVVHPMLEHVMTYPLQAIKERMNIRPDLSLNQVPGRALLWLSYTNFALDFPQPTAPNWIPIGGITAKPAKSLPEDMNDFVEGSGEHGIIVFTLGSTVTSMDNEETAEMIAKVFSELPQRVLWRYKAKKPRNLGNNTRIYDWLPQNDLLGHPKTRMIIYHGGAAGTYEATSQGVPMLIMPLGGDQMGNAARVVGKELGRFIDKNTMTEAEFKEAIVDILTDPKYEANMTRASAIMRESLVTPQELVVFWVEHVLKFGGEHLRLRALELNFIQRNSIDVIAFLVVALVLFVMIVKWLVVNCCCRLCCRRQASKQKRE